MTKKTIVLLVVMLIACISYSQSYQPFPTEDALWREMTGGYQSSNCTDYHILITGDTVVNGYIYSKLQKIGVKYAEDSWGICTDQIIWTFNYYAGAIRNDSANKNVYLLPEGSNEDTLFYDFKLSMGQVLPQTYAYYYEDGGVKVVSNIDSILIDDKYHMRYYISDTLNGVWTDYVELIEGIGTTFGLFGNLTVPFERGSELLCFKRNGYTVYPYVGSPCNLVTATEENEHGDDVLQVYPIPFTTSTTIEYELTNPSHIQITIYNTIGETVYKAEDGIKLQGKHTFIWSPESLPEGMYYAVLRSEEGVSVVKVIKQ